MPRGMEPRGHHQEHKNSGPNKKSEFCFKEQSCVFNTVTPVFGLMLCFLVTKMQVLGEVCYNTEAGIIDKKKRVLHNSML